MKIIFFGSSDYCLPVLSSLNNRFRLIAIVTKSGQSVEKFAQMHNIAAYTPADKEELTRLKEEITKLSPDLAIVADYGMIIPKEIFVIPLHKTLNIHFSKLPQFRGPSPVQYTILAGGENAWITVIIMDEEMDTGDIIWQKEISLDDKSTNYPINQLSNQPIKDTTENLYTKLFNIIGLELPGIINKYVNKELKPQKQDHSKATYTKHFTRQDGFIPAHLLEMAVKGTQPTENQLSKWNIFNSVLLQLPTANCQLPTIIERVLRALSPWPGLWTTIQITDNKKQITKRLKILKAHLEDKKFVLDEVQLESKKPVTWKQFMEGHPDFYF